MSFSLDILLLVFGLAGFMALLSGSLVVAGYLLCSGVALHQRPSPNPADDSVVDLTSAGQRWSVHLLVVLLGGALLSVQSVLWLWYLVSPHRPLVTLFDWNRSTAEPGHVELFPWE
ncbi:MAG: hypothetical protein WDM96_14985 [Lacunisphaera sp.]